MPAATRGISVGQVRQVVAARDVGCVAPHLDPDCGPCRDRWGWPLATAPSYLSLDQGEMDYVRLGAAGPRHALPGDHVWLCPGHHRGTGPTAGAIWATSHRPLLRAYLA